MTSSESMHSTLRFLGVGKDKSVILSSIFLVIISFFYFFVVGSGLDTIIYTFQFRVTYEEIFDTHLTSIWILLFSFWLLSYGFTCP